MHIKTFLATFDVLIQNLYMSLKIIHTADWHLGQTFFGYDREAEQDAFLVWLVDTLTKQQTDVLLIAGDVFDVANPSATAQRRFFRFLKEANRRNPLLQIVVVAGNHDSAARLEAPAPLLEELNTTIVGIIRRTDLCQIDFDSLLIPLYNKEGGREAFCLAVPYLRQGDYPATEEKGDTYIAGIGRMYRQLYAYATERKLPEEALIAMGHLHVTGVELSDDDRSERVIMGGLESVSTDTFDSGLAYTALGHIHKAQRVGGREHVRYAGSPLPMSFSEQHYKHQVVEFTVFDGICMHCHAIPIPQLCELKRMHMQFLPPEEVLSELSKLPISGEGEERNSYPFLEVRVLLTEPDPTFRHRVEEMLVDKAVRLTSIVPSYPKRGEEDTFRPLSYTDLQNIDPMDMLRHTFANRYGGELPEELQELFNEVIREVTR